MITKIMLLISCYSKLASSICHPCDNDIYCYGELLHIVQTSGLFQDSKHFIDMKMLKSPTTIKKDFDEMMKRTDFAPTAKDVEEFVYDSFGMDDLEPWTPPDYKKKPRFIQGIYNREIYKFAKKLVAIWPQLGRKLNDDVMRHHDRYSYIPLPNGMIVPGGRFRECYYWDSYWVVNGLLLCEMHDTVRGMLENFVTMVRRWGYVPNGNRIYYLTKSQPPLLTPMVYNYYKVTHDTPFLRQVLDYLEYELQFWLTRRFVNVKHGEKTYVMCRYNVVTVTPRPEAYKEDIADAKRAKNITKEAFYGNMQSGAESGWDFSSRWIFDEYGNPGDDLSKTEPSRVIPVDLNSYLYLSFKCLSEMYYSVGNRTKGNIWLQKSEEMKEAINVVLWNDKDHMWYDYDLKLEKHRRFFFASNLTPLWVRAYNEEDRMKYGGYGLQYLKKHELSNHFAAGIPASMHRTKQQWDFPNAWPPSQAIIIQGLQRTGHPEAQHYAADLAFHWIRANMKGMRKTGVMHEKYNVLKPGKSGAGGEYEGQSGFGWTNGVCLELINTYYTMNSRYNFDIFPLSMGAMCIAAFFFGAPIK